MARRHPGAPQHAVGPEPGGDPGPPHEEDGVTLLFTYRGKGRLDLASFTLE